MHDRAALQNLVAEAKQIHPGSRVTRHFEAKLKAATTKELKPVVRVQAVCIRKDGK